MLVGKEVRSRETIQFYQAPEVKPIYFIKEIDIIVLYRVQKLDSLVPNGAIAGSEAGKRIGGIVMRKLVLLILLLSALTVARAQDTDFQTGTIVTVEKVNSGLSTGGTDAATAQNRQRYKISIQLNDTIYVCRADATSDMDLEWAKGKEVPVSVKGKTLYLKRANGKVVKLSILESKKTG